MSGQKIPARAIGDGMMDWQPIDTAPQDGTVVLLNRVSHMRHFVHRVVTAAWRKNGWRIVGSDQPVGAASHWMPVPEPPPNPQEPANE
jgi:hypothetical protein